MVIASFNEHGFGLPLHTFVWGLLFYYGMELLNLHPNTFLHIACFITLCEAYLGMPPHWKLRKHLFSPRMGLGQGDQPFVGSFNIQLRGSWMASYLSTPLPSFIHGYEGVVLCSELHWSVPVAKPKWGYDAVNKFKPKISYMLDVFAK